MIVLRTILIILISNIFSVHLFAGKKQTPPYKFEEKCMGTVFRILIDHENFEIAQKNAFLAFEEANRLNKIFSDYESDSECSLLSEKSGTGKFYSVSDDLFTVLIKSQKLSKETNGFFDITIGPYSRLWRIARFRNSLPDQSSLDQAKKRVGAENIIIDSEAQKVKLTKVGMILDFGSIAKGYAADKMMEFLKAKNLTKVLIDAGGDIIVGNPPTGQNGWNVVIGGRKHSMYPKLSLVNTAVATSGDYEQNLSINGKTYSHIINPKTGIGLTNKAQVTVFANTATEADAFASTSLVLGKEDGIKFLKSKKYISAYYIQEVKNELSFYEINREVKNN